MFLVKCRTIDAVVAELSGTEGDDDTDEMAVLGHFFDSLQSLPSDYANKEKEIEAEVKQRMSSFHSSHEGLSSVFDELLPGIEYPMHISAVGYPSFAGISILR